MRRRAFIAAGCAAALASTAARGRTGRTPRIGILWHAASPESQGPYYAAVLDGFRELGYLDGQNIALEHRFAAETPERFRSMAAELAALGIEVLVTVGPQTAPYARAATTTLAVVFVGVPDPVGSGFVESLARPGGNMTGLSNFGADILAKRLQFLKDMTPGLTRAALLVNPNNPVTPLYRRVTQAAAADLGLEHHEFEVRSADDLERVFDAIAGAGMQALTINADGLAFQQRSLVGKLALERRLPLGVWSRESFEGGALMSYGPDQVAMCRRAPLFVDRILKGARPGDIPVEQPTKLELFVNLKVARALGLLVPPMLLALADEVIE
jgi:putative tryptophan/tyrosine transport system substrate-binding protein